MFGAIGKVGKMSFQANVLKVMIASPDDVAEERKIVTGAIYRWNDTNASMRRLVLLPIKWEIENTLPLGVSAQTVINRQLLDDADIVIGIFGTPIGTPTEQYISGTVEEIKKHVAAGKTAKVYFSEVRIAQKKVDQNRYALVQKFREELNGSGLSATYQSMEQFRDDFEHHLALEMNHPRYRWLDVPDRTAGVPQLKTPIIETPIKMPIVETPIKTPIVERPIRTPIAERPIRTPIVETPIIETPIIDESQKNHVDDLLRSVGCLQRDLLRFLLLKGGIARADVIARARTIKNALEMNGLCGPLEQNSLLTRTPDHKYGYSTLAVNERMIEILPKSLFPREEDDPPFFEGI
jgi:hypothetical protein